MSLMDLLLTKVQEKKLGHFYLIETSLAEEEASLKLIQFITEFIQRSYQLEKKSSLTKHLRDYPDVFVLGDLPGDEEKKETAYNVEEAAQLQRFFQFKSMEGGRKYAIITHGHRINQLIANKWLKLLEEPEGESTIFILNPRRQKLLDTIHSRAQHIRIPAGQKAVENSEAWEIFVQHASKLSLSEFIEYAQKEGKDLFYWTEQLLIYSGQKMEQGQSKQAVLNWVRNFQEWETFHQPSATKWSLFYHFLKHSFESGVSD
jgi:hypothetical protein